MQTNTAGGIYVAFDGNTKGLALLIKSESEPKLKRFAGSVLNLIAAQATNDGNKVPFKKDTYRDANVAKFDNFLLARYESWLLISNKPELAKQIVDNLHDTPPSPLANQDWFV